MIFFDDLLPRFIPTFEHQYNKIIINNERLLIL